MKGKSEFLKGFGKMMEICKALVNEVLAIGGTDEHLTRILTDRNLRKELAKLIVGVGTLIVDNIYRIVVGAGLTLEAMIAEGKYDWKNGDITSKHFPMTEQDRARAGKDVDVELIHINRELTGDDALAELDRLGYRPASIFELLAFGAKFPEKQREFPIVALGSVWRFFGGRDVACLYRVGSGRFLRLNNLGYRFLAVCRFAAVRK